MLPIERTLVTAAAAIVFALGIPALEAQDEVACPHAPTETSAQASGVVYVPVSGLDQANAEQLQALVGKHACSKEACPMTDQAAACGDACTKMKDMSKMACFTPVVREVKVDVEKGELALSLAADHALRLSQMDKAFDESSFRVDRKRLRLTPETTLFVSGMSCGGCSSAVKEVFARVAGPVDVAFESSARSPVRLTKVRAGVTLDDAVTALTDSRFAIADVMWTAAAKAEAEGCCADGEAPANDADCCAEDEVSAKDSGGCCSEEGGENAGGR